jgi:hypothetical protein
LVGNLGWPLFSVLYERVPFWFIFFYVTNHFNSFYFSVMVKYFSKPFFSCLVI